MKSRTLGIYLGLIAALQFVVGFTSIADMMSPHAASWVQFVGGAMIAFLAVYTGRVASTPADNQLSGNIDSSKS